MKTFAKLFLLIFFLLTFNQIALSCLCSEDGVPPCAEFGRATGVFIGRVTKIERSENFDSASVIHFDVEQSFKGVNQTKIEVEYMFGTSCSWLKFEEGERWIIYGYESGNKNRLKIPFCTGSHRYSQNSDDFTFLNKYSQGKTKEYIFGKTIIEDYAEKDNALVTVTKDKKNYSVKTDNSGDYKLEVSEPGIYKVQVSVPFSGMLYSSSDASANILSFKETETIVEYEVKIGQGLCHFNQLNFNKIDLKANSSISGRILDNKGKPVPNIPVFLAQAGVLEKDSLKNRKLGWTDKTGNFKFGSLYQGRYLILINPYNFPEQDMPYLKTYLPGFNNFSDAMIIELEPNRDLSGFELKLPPQLQLKKIEGQVVWNDGKPVLKRFFNLKTSSPPWISIYKPNGSYLEHPETLKFTENGNFSFTVYDGFSYLISASAQNDEGKRLYGIVKIKADKDLKSFKIILNQEGHVDTEKFLRKIENKSN